MSEYIKKWLSPRVTSTSSARFRAKLCEDASHDGVELAGLSTPTATELVQISRRGSITLEFPDTYTSTLPDAAYLSLQPRDRTAQHPLADYADVHASIDSCNTHPNSMLEPAGSVITGRDASVTQERAASSQEQLQPQLHWQDATSDVRLVLSVLLELEASGPLASRLQQLLSSAKWEDVCEQCRDGLLLCAMLHHYFPGSLDPNSITVSAAAVKPSIDHDSHAETAAGGDFDHNKQHSDNDSNTHSSDALMTNHAHVSATQHFVDPLQHPLQHRQQQPQQQPSLDNSSQQCEALTQSKQRRLRDTAMLSAATAAGVLLPEGCNSDSIAAGQPDVVLQLLTAVIVAGEAQQHLQVQCRQVLQQLSNPWQSQLGPKAAHEHVQDMTTSCSASQGDNSHPLLACADVWPLVQTWLTVVASLGTQVQPQQTLAVQEAGSDSHQDSTDRQNVQQQPVPLMAANRAASNGDVKSTWEGLLSALQLLHQQQDAGHHMQQQLQLQQLAAEQLNTVQPGSFASLAHPSDAAVQANGYSGVDCSSENSIDRSTSWQLLQLLQQLGCRLALLQSQDLTDAALQGHDCPDAMQLVVLLRLLGNTSSMWLPAAAARAAGLQLQQQVKAAQPEPFLHIQQNGEQKSSDDTSSAQSSPRSCWPAELLEQSQLWPGDDSEPDTAVMSREERTLRCWINSLLHKSDGGRCSTGGRVEVSSGAVGNKRTVIQDGAVASGSVSASGNQAAVTSSSPALVSSASSSNAQKLGGCLGASAGLSEHAPRRQDSISTLSTATSLLETCSSIDINSLDLQEFAVVCADHPLAAPTTGPEHRVSLPSRTAKQDAGVETSAPSAVGDATQMPRAAATMQQDSTAGLATLSNSDSAQGAGTTAAAPYFFSFRSISSLYGPEVRSGVLLLELLDHLQPGCVDWKVANRLPFKGVGMAPQLQALENCQLALKVAQEDLGLPLVSMSARDVVLGRRKVILSLVYQLMRYHTMQLLESIAAAQQQGLAIAHRGIQQLPSAGLHSQQSPGGSSVEARSASSSPEESPSVTPRAGSIVRICSSSKKQRKGRQLGITEKDILDWANGCLQQVQPLIAQAGSCGNCQTLNNNGVAGQQHAPALAPTIRSFRDPALSSGVLFLQLLHAMQPNAVDLAYVTPGLTSEQRESNAKYALSVADKMGCSLFLVWEDLVDVEPRMVLVLLASLMCLDQTKQL